MYAIITAGSLSINYSFKKLFITLGLCSMCLLSMPDVRAEQINIEKLNFELGVKSLKQDELKEAIKYFKLVLKKDPLNTEAHYNIAIAYKKLGMHEESLNHFNRVVELLNSPQTKKPDPTVSSQDVYSRVKSKENDYVDLGDMHADSNQHEAAIEYYNLAIKTNPYNDNTYFKVCRCYMAIGDYINAEAYLQRALELNPENSRYKYYQDKVSQKINSKYVSEIVKREKIVLENLNDENFLKETENKNYEKELFDNKWEETTSEINLNTAHSTPENSQQKKIEEYYQDDEKRETLYQVSSIDDKALNQSQELDYLDVGDLYFDNQDYETAINYYKTALDINNNNDYTHYKLSRCYIELKDFKTADLYIKNAMTLSKQNKKYTYFKNQITDSLAAKPDSGSFEAASTQIPAGRPEFYVDEIAQEAPPEYLPGNEPVVYKKPTLMERTKNAVTSIKMPSMPKVKMPEISKLPEKILHPKRSLNEKYLAKRQEKKEQLAEQQKLAQQQFAQPQKEEETIFYRKQEDYVKKEPPSIPQHIAESTDENRFQSTIKPPEKVNDTHSANYYNEKGIVFFKENNLEMAEDYFQKAVQLKPMYARGYNNIASIAFKQGNLVRAQKFAQKAIEVDPKFPEGYYNLALINKKLGNTELEIQHLDNAIKADPMYYEAYFSRGLAYYHKGDYDKAKYNFSEVLRFKNDHYLASQNLGIVYANELNYEMAEKYLNHAVKLNKENPRSYFYLGTVRKNSGKIVLAIEDLHKAIDLDPANYRAYIALSKCYEQKDQPDMALEVLRKAAEKNPKNAEIFNYLGLLNLKFNKYEDAAIAFKKAVENNPQRSIYYYNLSQCYLCMGKKQKSNYAFQRAVSIIPASSQDYTDLAEIFRDKGMASYSIRVLKEGIANLTQNDYLYLVLADFYEKTGAIQAAKEILADYLLEKADKGTFSLLINKKLNRLENL